MKEGFLPGRVLDGGLKSLLTRVDSLLTKIAFIFLVRWTSSFVLGLDFLLDQERDGHHPHLLLDPLHQGAGACAGEAEDGRPAFPDIAVAGFKSHI